MPRNITFRVDGLNTVCDTAPINTTTRPRGSRVSSIKDSERLKHLQSRRDKIAASIPLLKEEVTAAQEALVNARRQLTVTDKEITGLTASEPVVTEHAIIRYLERVMGLNLDQIRAEILSDTTRAQVKALRSGKFPIGNGAKAVVKNMTVVSVI